MSTAKKTLFATIGAGEKAIERTRAISSRLAELPTQFRSGTIKDLPRVASSLRTEGTKRVTVLVRSGRDRTSDLITQARKQTTREFDDLAKRGEKLVGSIRRSTKTKAAAEKTKAAKSRVKSASKAIGDAASAAAEAAATVVDRVEKQTDPTEATA